MSINTSGTGYHKTYTDRNRPFCGWYYDDQQNIFNTSRLLTVSLHANSAPVFTTTEKDLYADGDEKVKRQVPVTVWYHDNNSELLEDNSLLRYPYGRLDRDDSADGNKNIALADDVMGYFIEPLCTCFTSEDFNITVNNNYQQTGGDMLEQMWNGIKPAGPMVKRIMHMGKEFGSMLRAEAKRTDNGTVVQNITDIVSNTFDSAVNGVGGWDKLSTLGDNVEEWLNKSLVLNGARFSYYGGTNLAFNSLGMKFTLFPKWMTNVNGQTVMVPVVEQVNNILPYVVGGYEDCYILNNLLKTNDLDGVLGFNTPPGGFRSNATDVDLVQKGTLKLKIGSQYSLTNLVIESAQFNFSRQMVKNPSIGYDYNCELSTFGFSNEKDELGADKYTNGVLTPLYCDVSLQLRPITKYTSDALRKFITGYYNKFDIDLVNKEFNKNLKEGVDDMMLRYKTNQQSYLEQQEQIKREAAAKKREEDEKKRLLNQQYEEDLRNEQAQSAGIGNIDGIYNSYDETGDWYI